MTGNLIDICVIGSWKCGSTSLVKYLKQKFPDKWVGKQEVFHMKDELIELHNNEPDCIYYVILRRNIGAFHNSMHKYFYPTLTFQEYMKLKDVRKTGMSAEELADWQKHLNRWYNKVNNLQVVYLEEMQQNPNFPHKNQTANQFKHICKDCDTVELKDFEIASGKICTSCRLIRAKKP